MKLARRQSGKNESLIAKIFQCKLRQHEKRESCVVNFATKGRANPWAWQLTRKRLRNIDNPSKFAVLQLLIEHDANFSPSNHGNLSRWLKLLKFLRRRSLFQVSYGIVLANPARQADFNTGHFLLPMLWHNPTIFPHLNPISSLVLNKRHKNPIFHCKTRSFESHSQRSRVLISTWRILGRAHEG